MKKLYSYVPFFIIFILSFPPLLWWIPKGYVIDGSDIPFYVNPLNDLIKDLYPWDPTVNTGISTLQELPRQILYVIFQLLKEISPNYSFMSRLWYCIILFSTGMGMFLFSRKMFPKNTPLTPSLLSSVFYMYNLYFLVQITDTPIVLGYITFPLLLFVLHRAIETRKIVFYSAIFSFLTILFPPINPSSFAVFLLLFVVYVCFYTIANLHNIKITIRFLLVSFVFTFFINFRIIYPYFLFLYAQSSQVANNLVDWVGDVSKNTSFFHVVRLIGAWDWFENWFGEPYIPFAKKYLTNPFFIGISFIPVVFAFIGFWKTKTKIAWFLFVVGLFGILFSMGTHPPFQAIFIFFYNHVPLFWLFRSPWFKFSYWIVFSYSILIGFFIIWLLNRFSNRPRLNILICTVFILIFIAIAYPLFTGKRFFKVWEREGKLSATVVEYPKYLFKITDYFNKKEDEGRILFSPQFIYQATSYDWGYGSSRPEIILNLLTSKPILFMPFDQKSHPADFMNAITESFYANNTNLLANYLAILNASYILQQNDFNYKIAVVRNFSSQLNHFFSKQYFLTKEIQFGEWEIYKNSYVFPKIYSVALLHQISKISDIENISSINNPFAFIVSNDETNKEIKVKKIQTGNLQLDKFDKSDYFFETTIDLQGDSTIGFYKPKDDMPSLPILIDTEFKHSTPSGIPLTKGKHTIQISYTLSDNLAKNASIEKDLQDEWKYFDSDQKKGDLDATLTKGSDATDGNQSLKIDVYKKELRLYQQIPIDSDNFYLVSFDYKNMAGEKLKFLIDQEFGGVFISHDLPFSPDWSSKTFTFKPRGNSSFFDVYFSLPAGEGSEALIDNVQVKKIYAPILGFYYAKNIENQESKAEVSYEKIHPAEYKVNIQTKSPFYLIFNETYDPNWEATIDGKKIEKHFKVNSYANGYFIDKAGNFQIRLSQATFQTMNISLYVSILAFFVIITVILLYSLF